MYEVLDFGMDICDVFKQMDLEVKMLRARFSIPFLSEIAIK
jgi:hypothetical protein